MADNQSCKTDCYGTRNHQTDSVAASARLLDITRHQVRGSKVGIDAWMELLSSIPARFEDFSVTPTNMIAEGDQVFTQIHAQAKGLDANSGHYHKLVDGKIKEFWIYDDSQKMAHVMKAV